MTLASQVIIASQIEEAVSQLIAIRENERLIVIVTPQEGEGVHCPEMHGPDECMIITTEKQTFRVEDAKLAIEKAYMASKVETVIILAAKEFPPLIQNKLLKVIEEPPSNILSWIWSIWILPRSTLLFRSTSGLWIKQQPKHWLKRSAEKR